MKFTIENLKLCQMKKSIFLFISVSMLFSTYSTAQPQLSAEILKQLETAEKDMINALSNGDSAAFKKIAGKDYMDINANGIKMDLPSMLNDLPNFKGLSVNFSEQSQRVYGNFVLRTGKAKLSAGGQLIAEIFYTQGWVYRDKKWQFVHWQGTMTKDFLQMK